MAQSSAAPQRGGLDASGPLRYAVVDQELRDLLTEIGRLHGVHVQVADSVQGRVRGRLADGTAREVLDRLAQMHGFTWYHDGRVVHVAALADTQSRLLPLKGVSPDRLAATLASLSLADPRWPVRPAAQGGLVAVAGPPAFVGQVEQVLGALANEAKAEVRVVRGRSGAPS